MRTKYRKNGHHNKFNSSTTSNKKPYNKPSYFKPKFRCHNQKRKFDKRKCYFCGKIGHVASQCWKKHLQLRKLSQMKELKIALHKIVDDEQLKKYRRYILISVLRKTNCKRLINTYFDKAPKKILNENYHQHSSKQINDSRIYDGLLKQYD